MSIQQRSGHDPSDDGGRSAAQQALLRKVELALATLGSCLHELYAIYKADRRWRRLQGDTGALYTRCALDERLLRSRLGMSPRFSPPLPEAPLFPEDLLGECRRLIDAALEAGRDLEDYFSFFQLDSMVDFYRRVRLSLLELQSATPALLDSESVRATRRRVTQQQKPIEVQGRVRRALLSCPLYFILDTSIVEHRDAVKLGYEAVQAGVRMLQLRLKNLDTRPYLDIAQRLKAVCEANSALLFVNDRLDVALLSGADGIHLGETDPPVHEVRRIAPLLLIGATARRAKSAQEAEHDGADYIGCGSVFPSQTKPNLPLVGTQGLTRVVNAVSIPVVGIGGVTEGNARAVLASGAAGFCCIGPFRQRRSVGNLVTQLAKIRID